jgi:hypothetical protein
MRTLNMHQASELESLYARQRRTRSFMDYITYNEYLEKNALSVETKRTTGPLDPEEGKGFETIVIMNDGSEWINSGFYLTDKNDRVAFEKRPIDKESFGAKP